MALTHTAERTSRWTVIKSITLQIGCTVKILLRLVLQSEHEQKMREGLTTSKKDRIEEIEREISGVASGSSSISRHHLETVLLPISGGPIACTSR